MAREGLLYVLIPTLLAIILLAFGYWLIALPLLVLAAFMAFFFRDPERPVPSDASLIVSPADGKVTRVSPLDPNDPQSPTVVSIFLSPLDVHINRAPIGGTIKDIAYTRGKFLIATSERASLLNEQNALTIEGEKVTLVCKQIAGILARRIICWKRAGDKLTLGERFGLIKFSSRTDLILPKEVSVTINVGERVRGGVTVIGRIV